MCKRPLLADATISLDHSVKAETHFRGRVFSHGHRQFHGQSSSRSAVGRIMLSKSSCGGGTGRGTSSGRYKKNRPLIVPKNVRVMHKNQFH
jgi:hypothetical protein